MKLWPITTKNKYFVKMLWHLLGEYVKLTVLLVYSICTVHRFFYFLLLFFPSYQNILFFLQYFFHCSYSVFHCSSTVPFWLATFLFFFSFQFWTVATVDTFFLVFCLYFFFPFIYITVHPVFLHYACTIAATVLWFCVSFFFF